MFLHEPAEKGSKWLGGFGLDPLLVSIGALTGLIITANIHDPDAVSAVVASTVALSPIWLPVFLAVIFWITWVEYIRAYFRLHQEHVLLEIQLPPEVQKSPLSMELFLSSLHNAGGESTFLHRIWRGSHRPVWSLEIASNEGRISYYLYTRTNWKDILEARLYGQFPEAKITEVEDYAAKVPFSLDTHAIWGGEYRKGSAAAFPIRSYIDYGLDKNPDTPEIQVDPLTNVFELMGTMGKGEYMWMQIILKARKKNEWYGFYLGSDDFKDEAKKAIQEVFESAVRRVTGVAATPEAVQQARNRGAQLLSDMEKQRVEAAERSLTKLIFDCGIRAVYIAEGERFNGVNIGALVRFFDPFKYPDFNSLNISGNLPDMNYPWQDIGGIRESKMKRQLYKYYRERAYFYEPYDQVPVFMNTEELATLWHFPSSVVQTPSLQRVPSRRATAPANLPTGPAGLPTGVPSDE